MWRGRTFSHCVVSSGSNASVDMRLSFSWLVLGSNVGLRWNGRFGYDQQPGEHRTNPGSRSTRVLPGPSASSNGKRADSASATGRERTGRRLWLISDFSEANAVRGEVWCGPGPQQL